MRRSLAWLETLGQDLRMGDSKPQEKSRFLAVVTLRLPWELAPTAPSSGHHNLLCMVLLPYDHRNS